MTILSMWKAKTMNCLAGSSKSSESPRRKSAKWFNTAETILEVPFKVTYRSRDELFPWVRLPGAFSPWEPELRIRYRPSAEERHSLTNYPSDAERLKFSSRQVKRKWLPKPTSENKANRLLVGRATHLRGQASHLSKRQYWSCFPYDPERWNYPNNFCLLISSRHTYHLRKHLTLVCLEGRGSVMPAIHLLNASGEVPISSAVSEMLKLESLTKRRRTGTNAWSSSSHNIWISFALASWSLFRRIDSRMIRLRLWAHYFVARFPYSLLDFSM